MTDFGFAKKLELGEKTRTLCGTPEYMAPEVILGTGHDEGVDWWSLGVLIHEMLTGYSPFFDSDTYEVYQKIARGELLSSQALEPEAKSLISMLLVKDPSQRLGCRLVSGITLSPHPPLLSCRAPVECRRSQATPGSRVSSGNKSMTSKYLLRGSPSARTQLTVNTSMPVRLRLKVCSLKSTLTLK